MDLFLALTVAGLATYGCVYAFTALGLVVTYTTSGIFNFAQGAMGMLGAFLYWQLQAVEGWPSWFAFVVVAFVAAPLMGALVERLLMRRVAAARLEAKLTVTVGLLLFLIALAQWIWDPRVGRTVPLLFEGRSVYIGGVALTFHQLVIVVATVAVAAGLWLFFYRTRTGIATRAVVGDKELASLTGAAPTRFSMLGWALGTSMASIAGILLAPTVSMDIQALTLLVINGYAAAVVGRLRSLPLTVVGALVLGLLQSYAIGYLPIGGVWDSLGQVVPMLYLFAVILLLPQTRATIAGRLRVRAARVADLRESLAWSAGLVVVAVVLAQLLSSTDVNLLNRGVALSIVMLSLVLVTGYGGQVSLCQLTFAGLGAYAMEAVGDGGSAWGLLAAVGLASLAGTVVALPALRLRGLYLALATLAFGYGMDRAFFSNNDFFGAGNALAVDRVNLPWVDTEDNGTYLVLLCTVFAAVGVGLLAVRRSAFGRRLLAISDSPAACLTLGVNMTSAKLLLFAVSSGIAGLGGALYAGSQGVVGPNDFTFLLSATLLMVAVVLGIRTVAGVLLGGVFLAFGPTLQNGLSDIWAGAPINSLQLLVGLAAIGIARNPEGVFGGASPLRRWRSVRPQPDTSKSDSAATSDERRLSGVAH